MTTTELHLLTTAKSMAATKAPLELNSYVPNLDDPRIKKRIQAVLTWCDALMVDARTPYIRTF